MIPLPMIGRVAPFREATARCSVHQTLMQALSLRSCECLLDNSSVTQQVLLTQNTRGEITPEHRPHPHTNEQCDS